MVLPTTVEVLPLGLAEGGGEPLLSVRLVLALSGVSASMLRRMTTIHTRSGPLATLIGELEAMGSDQAGTAATRLAEGAPAVEFNGIIYRVGPAPIHQTVTGTRAELVTTLRRNADLFTYTDPIRPDKQQEYNDAADRLAGGAGSAEIGRTSYVVI